jgi:hypothetical protein
MTDKSISEYLLNAKIFKFDKIAFIPCNSEGSLNAEKIRKIRS